MMPSTRLLDIIRPVDRTIIQLTIEQRRALKAAAAAEGVSLSQLIRTAVERLLAERHSRERWKILRSAVGTVHDPGARAGIARRHDEYLDEPRKRS